MSPERYQRINQMLDQRQLDLTLCLENVHKQHNLAAVVRSADAVGVHDVHAVWHCKKSRISGGTALGSQNWVRVHKHRSIDDALQTIKQQGMQIVVTHLSDSAVDFREIDYTRPTAILLGQEKYGVSEQALAAADQQVVIPMLGMVQSLNVSVAGAVMLYEAQRQRQLAGMYQRPQLSEAERQRVLFEGGFPQFAKLCRQKRMAYARVDEHGQIDASDDWWRQMRSTQSLSVSD
ncbi:tRNA (guanosine(18)-2'-O)-methyltransferase TrmH [Idiomarina xiamenensis]|uniref:tRNA (guanosine(18)-2'-O)-methyltransferase n=1 Tax=Idiomarina xiamenensis 10-D-4 TaxID=740709 RepID=K2L3M5_9GAMM|nr:tRNA (guanosine(18)-2'-O)-methyltransferase TrmH [Idiomarina xiamenensis]EKE84465.1 tRNA guanosine-2'-O-methyltransferase [Idiomarina xiamenensis 10-D-4]